MLVVSRALQGFVAGPMYPITQSLLVSIYPREKRGQALALLAMITVVAPIAGPILGGWITDNYSWEWIFLINVPLGIIASSIVGSQLRHRPEQLEKPRMDYIGLILLVVGVGALQLVLDLGNDEDWFSSDKIVVLACVAAVALVVFVIWEPHRQGPHRRSQAVPAPQLPCRHAGDGGGVCGVFQRESADPAMAAARHGLHGDLGWPCHRTDRHPAGADDAICGQVRAAVRPAHARHRCLHLSVVHQLFALQLQFAGGLQPRGHRAVGDGRGCGVVLYAGAADSAVGSGRARDRGRLGPCHLPAHLGRQLCRIVDHLSVGTSHPGAPRAHHRAFRCTRRACRSRSPQWDRATCNAARPRSTT